MSAKHVVGMLGLLAGMSALSAVMVASASAELPAYFKGGVEVTSEVPVTITSPKGSLKAGFGSIECQKDEAVTEWPVSSGKKWKRALVRNETLATILYLECKLGTTACSNTGEAERILTKKLVTRLFYIKRTAPVEVGAWGESESDGTKLFAPEITCGAIKIKVFSVEGIPAAGAKASCVAGKVTSTLNVELETGTLEYAESGGKQAIESVEYPAGKTFTCKLETESGGIKGTGTLVSTETLKTEVVGETVETKA